MYSAPFLIPPFFDLHIENPSSLCVVPVHKVATKIQGKAEKNGILIGDTTLRRLPADKRICFTKHVDYPMSENEGPYPLHALTKYPDNQSITILIGLE
jgi:hypothetical protein